MTYNKAYSLVELLIAMLIASIIGLSIISIYSLSLRSFEIAQKKQIAMENARTSLDQIAEWVRWGGYKYDTGNPVTDFSGIYPCRSYPDNAASPPPCTDFNNSFGIITDLDGEKSRLNFYFTPNNDSELANEAFLMLEIIDITGTNPPRQLILTDGVLMPNTPIPGSGLAPVNFVEFYDINHNIILENEFPLRTGRGILVKLTLIGVNHGSQVDADGNLADIAVVPYTITAYTRNFMN